MVAAAFLGVLLTGWICHLLGVSATPSLPWVVSPLGASALLVFATPASPTAQPCSVIAGKISVKAKFNVMHEPK